MAGRPELHGLARQFVGFAHIHRIGVVREYREGHLAGAVGHGHGRRQCSDPADACRQIRKPVYLLRGQVEPVDILEPVLITDEIQVVSIRRELGIVVQHVAEGSQGPYFIALHIEQRKTVFLILQLRKVRIVSTAIGRKSNVSPVWRPVRLQVRKPVVRQLAHGTRFQVQDIQVADAAFEAGKRNGRSVRRPGKVRQCSDSLYGDVLPYPASPDIENGYPVVPARERNEGQLSSVR